MWSRITNLPPPTTPRIRPSHRIFRNFCIDYAVFRKVTFAVVDRLKDSSKNYTLPNFLEQNNFRADVLEVKAVLM